MIPSTIRQEILRRLRAAEEEHDVKVLLAIESGSRAWGFPSPNSDYDARFIYINRRDWYLAVSLEEQRDVIEYPIVDEIDINGWDLRKALRLFSKSNPALVEARRRCLPTSMPCWSESGQRPKWGWSRAWTASMRSSSGNSPGWNRWRRPSRTGTASPRRSIRCSGKR